MRFLAPFIVLIFNAPTAQGSAVDLLCSLLPPKLTRQWTLTAKGQARISEKTAQLREGFEAMPKADAFDLGVTTQVAKSVLDPKFHPIVEKVVANSKNGERFGRYAEKLYQESVDLIYSGKFKAHRTEFDETGVIPVDVYYEVLRDRLQQRGLFGDPVVTHETELERFMQLLRDRRLLVDGFFEDLNSHGVLTHLMQFDFQLQQLSTASDKKLFVDLVSEMGRDGVIFTKTWMRIFDAPSIEGHPSSAVNTWKIMREAFAGGVPSSLFEAN